MTDSDNRHPLAQVLRQARAVLTEAAIESADLDARLLVEWSTGCDQLELIRNPNRVIGQHEYETLQAVLARRINGESVHRIIGKRAFFGIELSLSTETLEPRPDTESLVELALPFLQERISTFELADIVDLGTGTGAIALALLDQLPQLRAVGVDISADALATARKNAGAAGVSSRFAALLSDWFSELTGSYDMIISNPPYIPAADIEHLQREVVLHDPVKALDGGADGLDPYRIIAASAHHYLRPGGAVALEIGAGQREDIETIFSRQNFVLHDVKKDLGGHERALLFTANEK
ncbi:peptide chain release factor N(5)-glutamine methyltransferase [Phyllobacterium sp. YR531]|uniref:peptide chain release factor N(5)-glutamine methyltransferase n=1 Tax=Phyllobacterium sp. YR531 TaxID=1144343 RepID=UPI00026F904C|nr:peptide chain release factor N(5)-glutamine methyltransferase [Phyllobacterium sp. YR531]EJM99206.1 protein-(glutamine-N5) methyltransferase, release factor-specific [Phyllobacterium sp. YR531]